MTSDPVLARDLEDEPDFVPPSKKRKRKKRAPAPTKPLAKTTPMAARVAGVIGAIIGFVAAYYGVQRAFFPARDMTSIAFLQQMSNDLNKRMPTQIDSETLLVTTVAPETGVFEYRYRLVNQLAEDLDGPKVMSMLKPTARNSSCTSPATRKVIDRGVTLRYSYMDKEGTFVGSFDVTPKDCAAQ